MGAFNKAISNATGGAYRKDPNNLDFSGASGQQLLDWRKGDLQQGKGRFSEAQLQAMYEEGQNRRATELKSAYESLYKPEVEQYGQAAERDALSAFQQEKARALQQLGYAQSSGSGGSGMYDAAQIALERGSQQQLGQIKRTAEMYEMGHYLQYLKDEDIQSHQLDVMREQFNYQMQIAEQNSSSWWEGLANIAGMGLAIWQPWNRAKVTNTSRPSA